MALKVLHALDGREYARRADVVQALLGDSSNYTQDEIDNVIPRLHTGQLIESQQGPFAKITIRY